MITFIRQNIVNSRNKISSFRVLNLIRYAAATGQSGRSNEEIAASDKAEQTSKKLRAKTPIGKLDELDVGKHPYQEKEPLKEWPNNTNPHTGEVGGPRGPEPTRYGDWERKGRVSDF